MSVFISVVSDWDGRGIQKAIQQFQKLQTTSEKAQFALKKAALPAAAALGGLAVAGYKAATAAAEDQRSQALLARQLRNSVGATDAMVAQVEREITAFMNAAAVSDDVLRPSYARIVSATKDMTKANEIMQVSLDTAAAVGLDVSQVANAMALGFAGNTRALAKLSPELKKLIKEGASFSDVMAVLQQNFGGAAREAAGTTAGKLELMRIKFGEMQESLGTALLPLLDMLATVLGKVASFAEKHPRIFTSIALAVGLAATAIIAANAALKVIAIQAALTGQAVSALTAKYVALAAAAAPWLAIGAGIAAIGYGIYKSFTESGKAVDDAMARIRAAIEQARRLKDEARAAAEWTQILGSAGAAYGALGGYTKDATKNTKGLSDAIDKAAEAAKKLRSSMRDMLQTVADDAKTKLEEAKRAFSDYAAGLSGQIMGDINFGSIVQAGEDTKTSFLDGLKISSADTKNFTVLLNRLIAGGASQAVVEGVAGAGVDAGTKIANELLGTVGGIETANKLTAEAQKAADQFGTNAASKWAQAGVTAATAYVDAVATIMAKYLPLLSNKNLSLKRLKEIQNQLRAELANISVSPSPEMTPSAPLAPGMVRKMDSPNVQINVNGGDPQAVVDALRKYMFTNGSIPIRVTNA